MSDSVGNAKPEANCLACDWKDVCGGACIGVCRKTGSVGETITRLELEVRAARAECERWRQQALEENAALDAARDEIAALKGALDPVIHCEVVPFGETGEENAEAYYLAIRYCQAIYRRDCE